MHVLICVAYECIFNRMGLSEFECISMHVLACVDVHINTYLGRKQVCVFFGCVCACVFNI